MISRYNVWLNGVSLAGINPQIYVSDISYRAVEINRDNAHRAGNHGTYRGNEYIESLHVDVLFQIESYGTAERQELLQQVAAWARKGGWLETSDRPYKRLYVVCDVYPSINSAMRWLDTITMTFSAYELPFWQEKIPNTVSVTAAADTDGSAKLFCQGYFPANLEAEITPGASIETLSISVAGKTMAFDGLTDAGKIKISYTDDRNILTVTQGDTSVLDKRTAASADDLPLVPGEYNTITVHGSAALSAVFSVRGLTL